MVSVLQSCLHETVVPNSQEAASSVNDSFCFVKPMASKESGAVNMKKLRAIGKLP